MPRTLKMHLRACGIQEATRHLALYIIVLLFDLLLKYFLELQYFIALETNTGLNLASR